MKTKLSKLTLLLFVLLGDCSASKSFNQVKSMPVKKAIEDFGICPDVIKTIPKDIVDVSLCRSLDHFWLPQWSLVLITLKSPQISYGNLEVVLGNELKPVQVKNIPTKIDYPFKAGKHYTLCMTDPDAPSRWVCLAWMPAGSAVWLTS